MTASRFGGFSKLGTIPAGGVAAGPFKSASSFADHGSGVEEAVWIPIDRMLKHLMVEMKMEGEQMVLGLWGQGDLTFSVAVFKAWVSAHSLIVQRLPVASMHVFSCMCFHVCS